MIYNSKFKVYYLIYIFLTIIIFYIFYPVVFFDRAIDYDNTVIYDRNEIKIIDIPKNIDGYKKHVSLDKVNKNFIDSLIFVEDKRFYHHFGIDVVSKFRAFLVNLKNKKITQGGSTITEQMIKNRYFIHNKRTFLQKIREFILAVCFEIFLSKQDILEMYINNLYFGNMFYGVETASNKYFGKLAKDLTLSESLVLVRSIRHPTKLNPYTDLDFLIEQKNKYLKEMYENDFIKNDRYEYDSNQNIVLIQNKKKVALHFVDKIKEILNKEYPNYINGGYKVYTTLDLKKQVFAEDIIDEKLKLIEDKNVNNGAMLVIDSKDGDVLTMVGSRDYFDNDIDGRVNLIYRKRQVGSVLKPIIYFMLFNKGANPQDLILDIETKFNNEKDQIFYPFNYGMLEAGVVTLREALSNSLNIPALKITEFLGVENVYNMLNIFGLNLSNDPFYYGLSLALGSPDIKLIDLARAYTIFANDGEMIEPLLVKKIYFGKKLLKEYEIDKKIIFNKEQYKESFEKVRSILIDEKARQMSFGYNNILNTDSDIAVKTGTTRNFRDNFTISYSNEYVVLVWVGNNNAEKMVNVSGITGSAPIWREFINEFNKKSEYNFDYDINQKISFDIADYCLDDFAVEPNESEIDKFHRLFKDKKKIVNCNYDLSSNNILFPNKGEVFYIDESIPVSLQNIFIRQSKNDKIFLNDEFLTNQKVFSWELKIGDFRLKNSNSDIHFEVKYFQK